MSAIKTFRVVLVLLALAGALVAWSVLSANGVSNRLTNGNFEEGFGSDGVGLGWGKFEEPGEAFYSWHDDTWPPVVFDGQHSQLIEISTLTLPDSIPDRLAGIFQTIAVVPGATYQLTIHGMLRAREDDPDMTNYSYRVQWGFHPSGGTNWKEVTNWVEIPWDTVYPRLTPGAMQTYTTSFVAPSARITLFIRVWKKWGTPERELDVNVDGISLTGPEPADVTAPTLALDPPAFPVVGKTYPVHITASNDVGVIRVQLFDNGTLVGEKTHAVGPLSLALDFAWKPTTAGAHTLKAVAKDASGKETTVTKAVTVGASDELLKNGNFEGGFGPDGVALNWWKFDNGGEAFYSWHDDTWASVVFDGQHSQLIEISTLTLADSDFDRYAGICQVVEGLTPDSTLQLTMHGMLRAMMPDRFAQEYGYRVQWGFDPAGGNDWKVITNWVEVPWDTVYDRLSPGAMLDYYADFQAPSAKITFCVRAWKKWPSGQNELDVNLDGLSLKGFK